MKKALTIFGLLLCSLASQAQVHSIMPDPLLPDAERIKYAYEQLVKAPLSPVVQTQYITSYPATKKSFMDVFNSAQMDQLYNVRHIYLDTLKSLGKIYPKELLSKLIVLGKDLKADGDISSELQKALMILANAEPAHFAAQAKQLKKKELDSFIRFLADNNNYSTYPEYELLIGKLQPEGNNDLVDKLINSKKERQKNN